MENIARQISLLGPTAMEGGGSGESMRNEPSAFVLESESLFGLNLVQMLILMD